MSLRRTADRAMAALRRMRVSGTWNLGRDVTLRIGRRGAARVEVQSGRVLITREGDPTDHVLGPGMALLLTREGLAVAWALEASRLRVRALTETSRPLAVAVEPRHTPANHS